MKRLLIISSVLLGLSQQAAAQLSAGAEGWYVTAGTTWFTDSLVLTPSVNTALVNNTLTRSSTPVGGGIYAESVKRVYAFSAPFNFSGDASFYFLEEELNGNTAADLQLAYLDDAGTGTTTTGGFANTFNNSVWNFLSDATLSRLTAINGGVPLPLSGAGLQAVCYPGYILLSATVLDNENYARLEVERSSDGQAWQAAGTIARVEKHGSVAYSFRDTDTHFQKRQYRLVLTGKDGKQQVSAERMITRCTQQAEQPAIFATAQAGGSVLITGANNSEMNNARIRDMSGRTIWKGSGRAAQYQVQHLVPGVYLATAEIAGQPLHVRFAVQ